MNDIILLIISMAACLGVTVIRKIYMGKARDGISSTFLFNAISSLVAIPVFLIIGGFGEVSLFTLLLGIGFGIVTAVAAVTNLKALSVGPMSYTSIIISFSMVISALSGALFFNEKISLVQIIGIALMLVTLYLATGKGSDGRSVSLEWLVYCAVSFLSTGAVGVMQKIHQSSEHKGELSAFLIVAFAVSTVLSLILFAVFNKSEPKEEKNEADGGRTAIILSALMVLTGVCVALNNQLNLYLCGVIDSAVFFPVVNGGGLILSTLAALVIFKEKLTVKQWIGIGVGIVSVILLCNPF